MLSEEVAFEAMRLFLAEFWKRGGSQVESELVDLLLWTDRSQSSDGGTSDPAQWNDWIEAVRRVGDGERAGPDGS